MEPNGGGLFGGHKLYNQLTALVKLSGKTGKDSDKLTPDENLYIVAYADNIIKNPDGTCSFNLDYTKSDNNVMRKDKSAKKFVHAHASNYNISEISMEEFKPKEN